MSNYLRNLAAMVVHPGGGVRPYLPGRFETQHLGLKSQFDSMSSDDAELTSTSDVCQDEPVPPAKPAPTSSDLAAPTVDASMRGDRPHNPPPPAISQSPPVVGLEPPAIETGKWPTAPDKAGLVSPAPAPDISPDSTGSERLRPSEEHRPVPALSDELCPARFQPPAVAPAVTPGVWSTSAPELSPLVRTAALESDPCAQGSTSHIATSAESHSQIEPATPPPETGPSASKATQRPPANSVLERADWRTAIEPHFKEPLADVPLRQTKAEPAPIIRVIIGRIEVRAAMPSVTPPQAQPVRRRPALPLDQYLQQRNEGKQ